MKSTNYTEKVKDHFQNPRNVGTLEGEDVAVGKVGNPTCGDIMEVFIKVKDDVIEDVKFRTFGCGSAVATSSMGTVMAKGKSLDEALEITRKDIAEKLGGLPPIKMHCSNLAADALHEAIKNYRLEQSLDPSEREAMKRTKMSEIQEGTILGELKYLNKGLTYYVGDLENFEDERVLVMFKGEQSVKLAIELTKFTGRVILPTIAKELVLENKTLQDELDASKVKVLTDSKILEFKGEGEIEKVKILNLDEDEDYELFVDRVIIPETLGVKITHECEDSDCEDSGCEDID